MAIIRHVRYYRFQNVVIEHEQTGAECTALPASSRQAEYSVVGTLYYPLPRLYIIPLYTGQA